MDRAQILYLNRDVEFPVWLKNADGSAYVIAPGAQFALVIYSSPGVAVATYTWGAGISEGSFAAGRLDVAGGVLSGITTEHLGGSIELYRTDTGADVIACWPVHILKEGRVPFLPPGAVAINMGAGGVTITTNSGFGGPAGPAGGAGPSALVGQAVPFFPNGDFAWWDLGTGPFTATGTVMPGLRFQRNASSTHALTRVAGFGANTKGYALRWDRTVTGGASSFLKWMREDLRYFDGKTVTVAFEVMSDVSRGLASRLVLNYGTGGSAQTTQNAVTTHTANATPATIVRASMAIDLTGKTVADDSSLEFNIYRTTGHADGPIDIQNVRMWEGGADYGMPLIDRALGRAMLDRRLEVLNTRSINGTTRVYYGKKRAVPAITASAGTVSNIAADSCDLTHTSAANVILTIDAELTSS